MNRSRLYWRMHSEAQLRPTTNQWLLRLTAGAPEKEAISRERLALLNR